MNLDSIQLGLDIATSISIVGAAIAYFVNFVRERIKARSFALMELRLKYMQDAIRQYGSLLERVYQMEDRLKWLYAGDKSQKIEIKDIIQLGYDVKNLSNTLLATYFSVWAREEEKDQVKKLMDSVDTWCNAVLSKTNKNRNEAALIFLADALAQTVRSLSESIKKGCMDNIK